LIIRNGTTIRYIFSSFFYLSLVLFVLTQKETKKVKAVKPELKKACFR